MAEWNHGAAPAKNKLIPKANITQITRSGRTLRHSIRICSSSEIIVVAWLRVYTSLKQETQVQMRSRLTSSLHSEHILQRELHDARIVGDPQYTEVGIVGDFGAHTIRAGAQHSGSDGGCWWCDKR